MRKGYKSTIHIRVIADDHEQLVSLPNTLYDDQTGVSLISKTKAFATQGQIKIATPTSVVDALGACHSSSSTIRLRWRYEDSSQSFEEDFYVVDTCGTYDAILRGGVNISPQVNAIPQAHPITFHTKDKDRVRDQRDQARRDQEKYNREVAEQKEMVKRKIEGMKQKR